MSAHAADHIRFTIKAKRLNPPSKLAPKSPKNKNPEPGRFGQQLKPILLRSASRLTIILQDELYQKPPPNVKQKI